MNLVPACALLLLSSCSSNGAPEPSVLEVERPVRIGACTVMAGAVNKVRASFQFTCKDVGPAAAHWWGDAEQPLGFELELGDCMRLNTRYYCVTSIDERGRKTEVRPLFEVEGGGLLLRRAR